MDFDMITWIWLIGGLLMIGSELFIPGLIMIFLGVSATLIAGARWLGLLQGELASLTWWFLLSMILVLGLRTVLLRFLPGNSSYQPADEDVDAFGEVAEVVDEISCHHQNGRILFHGTTWPAICEQDKLPPGSKVKVLARDNIHWIVEPVDKLL